MQLRKRQRCDYTEEQERSDDSAHTDSDEPGSSSEPCSSSDWEGACESPSEHGVEDEEDNNSDPTRTATDHASCSSKAGVDEVLATGGDSKALAKLTVAVLREHLKAAGLRTTGLKAELIQRVQGHHSLSARSPGGTPATALTHPESSFTLHCVGDVCKGDTVLFKQKVYAGFDVTSRMGNFLGHRTVAGRVVKESYGAQKQQHTFSIEVLWSEGVQALRPFQVLLIKGRNLYRTVGGVGVRRQPWADESQRRACLEEKHARGAAARAVRAKRKGTSRAAQDQRSRKRLRKGHDPGPLGFGGLPNQPHHDHGPTYRPEAARAPIFCPGQPQPPLRDLLRHDNAPTHGSTRLRPGQQQPHKFTELYPGQPQLHGPTEPHPGQPQPPHQAPQPTQLTRLQPQPQVRSSHSSHHQQHPGEGQATLLPGAGSFPLTAQVVGSWQGPGPERPPLQALPLVNLAGPPAPRITTLGRPPHVSMFHAPGYPAAMPFSMHVAAARNGGNKQGPGGCTCRCGDSAAKACAYGLCGKCCQGHGCARHGKRLGASRVHGRGM